MIRIFGVVGPRQQRFPYNGVLPDNSDMKILYTVPPRNARPADEDDFEMIDDDEKKTTLLDFKYATKTLSEDACHIDLLQDTFTAGEEGEVEGEGEGEGERTADSGLCIACLSALGCLAKDIRYCIDADEQGVPEDNWTGARSVVHYQNVMALFVAALGGGGGGGCHICKTIWTRELGNLEFGDWLEHARTHNYRTEFCWNSTSKSHWLDPDHEPGSVRLICNVVSTDVEFPRHMPTWATLFRFQLWPSPEFDHYFEKPGRDDQEKTTSGIDKGNTRSSKPLAQRWLFECQANVDGKHSGCQLPAHQGDKTQCYPRRLLNLSRVADSGKVLLVDTTGRAANDLGDYITLSHCWGEWGAEELPVLTQSNITERLQDGVEVDLLPPTFQDAIEVAGWFSVNYLWIDSLCIIQDVLEDWSREAPNMCNIYQTALLNISADHAVDAREGCFRDRNHDSLNSFKLHIKPLGRTYWFSVDERNLFLWVENAPCSDRAWIFQERHLVRRVLHFTAHEVFWECRAAAPSFRSESFPGGSPLQRDFLGQTKLRLEDISDSSIVDNPMLLRQWMNACQGYSRRKLTRSRPSDKTAALSGIVRHFGSRCQDDEYVAGIWQSEIPHGLFWSVPPGSCLEHSTQEITPGSGFIPSWSWMSYPGPIEPTTLHSHHFTSTAEITLAVKRKNHEDHYGDLEGAKLLVRGFIRRIVVVNDPLVNKSGEEINGNLADMDPSQRHVHLYVDVDKQQLENTSDEIPDIAWGPVPGALQLFWWAADWHSDTGPDEYYYCLLLGVTQEADPKADRLLRGLLLSEPVESGIPGVPAFRRVGHCRFGSRCALRMRYRRADQSQHQELGLGKEQEKEAEHMAWEQLWQRVAPYWAGLDTDMGGTDETHSSERKEGPLLVDVESDGPETLYAFDGDAADDPAFEKLEDVVVVIIN